LVGLLQKAKRDIAIRGNPKILVQFHLKLLYQFSDTLINCIWQQIARMEMDCNLKTLGLCFQVSALSLGKNHQKLTMVSFPFEKIIQFLSLYVPGAYCVQKII